MIDRRRPRVLLVYHFFHPDDVDSARQFTELGIGLHERGWDVTALTSNRLWGDPNAILPARETWRGMDIVRVHRPAWKQAKQYERLANSAWMVGAWTARVATLDPFDAMVTGSDPAFSPTFMMPVKAMRPNLKIAHWCFDLYPEAIQAEGMGRAAELMAPVSRQLMKLSYKMCDHVVNLGPGMEARLAKYGFRAPQSTIAPWPLVTPDTPKPAITDISARKELFGNAKLGLLYSGNLGRAHEFEIFLKLARRCRAALGDSVAFTFSCRGHRADALRDAIGPTDTNVRLASFCSEEELAARLDAADIHLLSLRPQWSGVVVPSKFFGSLAAGKPVLYAGEPSSDVGQWISQFNAGMTLNESSFDTVYTTLKSELDRPSKLPVWKANARRAYETHFSKSIGLDRWDSILRSMVYANVGHEHSKPRPTVQASPLAL